MGETIGFIGLGMMGQAMAHGLLKAGYALPVYNRDARKAETLVLDAAAQAHVPMPLASLNHDRLLSALTQNRGEMDWTSLAQLVDHDAGLDSL